MKKIIAISLLACVALMAGCTTEGDSSTGTGNIYQIRAGQDIKEVIIDDSAGGGSCPAGTPFNPECSVESQQACSCTR